jgi:hypothetical protein
MRKLMLLIPAAALAAALLITSAPVCTAQLGCGIKPIKPIPPIGCADLVAECRCDARGQNCRWTWICVKR